MASSAQPTSMKFVTVTSTLLLFLHLLIRTITLTSLRSLEQVLLLVRLSQRVTSWFTSQPFIQVWLKTIASLLSRRFQAWSTTLNFSQATLQSVSIRGTNSTPLSISRRWLLVQLLRLAKRLTRFTAQSSPQVLTLLRLLRSLKLPRLSRTHSVTSTLPS